MTKISSKLIFFLLACLFLNSCGFYKKVDTRKVPINAQERAKQNVQEGRGVSLKSLAGGRGTNYEFSTSNPLWRATLEIIDFIPLSTVDYSGGLIITDWYSNTYNDNELIKITIRFLSNEVRSDSLKVIVHKKTCTADSKCKISIIKSKISNEMSAEIIKKAATIEQIDKNKKK